MRQMLLCIVLRDCCNVMWGRRNAAWSPAPSRSPPAGQARWHLELPVALFRLPNTCNCELASTHSTSSRPGLPAAHIECCYAAKRLGKRPGCRPGRREQGPGRSHVPDRAAVAAPAAATAVARRRPEASACQRRQRRSCCRQPQPGCQPAAAGTPAAFGGASRSRGRGCRPRSRGAAAVQHHGGAGPGAPLLQVKGICYIVTTAVSMYACAGSTAACANH